MEGIQASISSSSISGLRRLYTEIFDERANEFDSAGGMKELPRPKFLDCTT